MSYDVSFSSPGSVGVSQNVVLTWDGDDLGGVTFTVSAADGGAGGSFSPTTQGGSDGGAGPNLLFHYTPAAPGTVTFNFTCDNGDIVFRYTPATLTVGAGGRSASSMSLGLGGRGSGMGLGIS